MSIERLDKIISSQLNMPRSEVRTGIRKGLASVDGRTVLSCDSRTDTSSEIVFGGRRVGYRKFIYILMNKPAGVLSASEDKSRETVVDLIPPELRRRGLFPVGRLDRDTTGLLLITDDGDYAHSVISPKNKVEKVYIATVDSEPDASAREKFAAGVVLADGTVCRPAGFDALPDSQVRVTVTEGKYHQVKRMLGTVGLGVNELKRIRIGNLELPENLAAGGCEEISSETAKKALETR